ncbi:uncharacterized protein LOC100831532 [Brachypodium distachyon]|uniref:Uncharacterized protein n=1 Tax=Brachypodium distachyon TaxID=15368 RepID=I1HKI3_BRADI|nr:uncharacterized protein LOC100831532 [Brachypodium distachyon]KQK06834.1 hypothetical protein BRADI_2g30460v3 [Brachypodium distachyon]|eukprot:XP_003566374.1 uncharacterized protein LOC100831532 [Brachypodium distachyon]
MKREGFQHGAVRVNRSKLLRIADGEAAKAAAAAEIGVYARAPSKPTNASRSTGKCRRPRCVGCHEHPVTKARDKAKGAHKLRACDVALNHRLVSWRVVDGAGASAAGTGIPDYKGASASAVLAYMAGGNSWHEEEEDDGADLEGNPPAEGGLSDLYDLIVGRIPAPDGLESDMAHANNIEVADSDDAIEEQEQDDTTNDDDDDDEEEEEEGEMDFCMVGITIALDFSDGEEDWIVVEEIPST